LPVLLHVVYRLKLKRNRLSPAFYCCAYLKNDLSKFLEKFLDLLSIAVSIRLGFFDFTSLAMSYSREHVSSSSWSWLIYCSSVLISSKSASSLSLFSLVFSNYRSLRVCFLAYFLWILEVFSSELRVFADFYFDSLMTLDLRFTEAGMRILMEELVCKEEEDEKWRVHPDELYGSSSCLARI